MVELRRAFPYGEEDETAMPTGAPGRPSKGMHLIQAEFERRVGENACEISLHDEATYFHQWFRQCHPQAQPPTVKTIENNIRSHHRRWKDSRSSAGD
jgi:hypothetical protein